MFRKKKVAEKKTVLFVDDDEIVLQSLERGLLDESYNKVFTKNCKDALEIIQEVDVHVIVTDMCMPEMTGLDLLRAAREEKPDVVGVVLTGYEEDKELKTAVEQGEIFKLVPKPWKFGVVEFESQVRGAINNYNLQNQR
jgi:two-component system NtrC family sensor kinase